jgi:hypothetical protein
MPVRASGVANWTTMRKWRVLFTIEGVRTETVVSAPSQLQALMIVMAQYAGTDAHAFNAIEIH